MPMEPVVTSTSTMHCEKCISWSAIFIGGLVAIGLSFLLNLFNTGLSLSSFTTNPQGLEVLAIGGFIWLIVSGYIVMFVAGWIAGVLAKPSVNYCGNGVVHGFAAWCLAILFMLIMTSHMGAAASVTAAAQMPYDANATVQTLHNEQVATNAANQENPNVKTPKEVKLEKTANVLGIGVLATFFIFLLGAIGSCVGGYLGRSYRSDATHCHRNP